jgi:fumarate hydratase class II
MEREARFAQAVFVSPIVNRLGRWLASGPRCGLGELVLPANEPGRNNKADDEGTTLREAALASGYVTAAEFDRIVNPRAMVRRPNGGS